MTLPEVAGGAWDVIIVGAGPAGGVAALLLARQGRRVLLVDHGRFPREKACGCCLGARGAQLAKAIGLGRALARGTPLQGLELRSGGRVLSLDIPEGIAVARSEFDTGIAHLAVEQGAVFMDCCSARLSDAGPDMRRVQLAQNGVHVTVSATLVLACDGIRGKLLDGEAGCDWQIAADAWMGAAVTLPHTAIDCPAGTICMHLAEEGYVGAVRLAGGQVHLAAALDPACCKHEGGPALAVLRILRESAGIEAPELREIHLLGTPLLTRRRATFGAHRVLALGDACAYVEPFTGEGMTWAIESAVALARFLPDDLRQLSADAYLQWTSLERAGMKSEQSFCWKLRWMLHRPAFSKMAMHAARMVPPLARVAVGRLSAPVKEIAA